MALLQKWDDEDVTSALEWLQEQLTANIQLLSSFEKYKKEVLSGSLDWTPMHTSQQVRAPLHCCARPQLCALHVCCIHHQASSMAAEQLCTQLGMAVILPREALSGCWRPCTTSAGWTIAARAALNATSPESSMLTSL